MEPASVQQLPGFQYSYSTAPNPFQAMIATLAQGLGGVAKKRQTDQENLMSAFPALISAGMVKPATAKTDNPMTVGGYKFELGSSPKTSWEAMTNMIDYQQKLYNYKQDMGEAPLSPKDIAGLALGQMKNLQYDPTYIRLLGMDSKTGGQAAAAYAKSVYDRTLSLINSSITGGTNVSTKAGSASGQPGTVRFRVGRQVFEVQNDPATIANFKKQMQGKGRIEPYTG